jgi:hypothetical protein
MMMREGKSHSILWAAHVLPIYVLRFNLNIRDALKLLEDLELEQWVDGSYSDKTISVLVKNVKACFISDENAIGCTAFHRGVKVPQMRCVFMHWYDVSACYLYQVLSSGIWSTLWF